MRWMRWALIVSICGLSAVVPGTAAALVLAPPGHSGASQYFETIPTSAGNAAPPGSVPGSGSAGGSVKALAHLGHARAGAARLAKLGKAGDAAAVLAASTAPRPVAHAAAATSKATLTSSPPGGGSVATGLSDALTGSDSGGLGLLLPLLLATGLIVALGIGLGRLRRRANPTEPGV